MWLCGCLHAYDYAAASRTYGLSTGSTKLIHKEHFSGFAIPFASLDAIEEGYTQMNLVLKDCVENSICRREK